MRHESVSFEIAGGCEQKCAHCYNVWKGPDAEPVGRVSTETYKAVMTRALRESGAKRAVITGGEPLNHPDFLSLAAHARSLVPRLTVITNGNRLAGVAPALARIGATSVQVTLLAGDAARHDELKGDEGSFLRTLSGAVACLERGIEIVVCFVCTPENFEEFPKVLEIVAALGVRHVSFNRASPTGWAVTRIPQILPEAEMLERCLEAAEAAHARFGIRTKTAMPLPPCVVGHERFPHVEFGFCGVGREGTEFAVDPTGVVRSCNLSSTALADLRIDSWKDAEAHPYLDEFRAALPEACRSCEHALRCRGGCKESSLAVYGSLVADDPLVRLARTGDAVTSPVHTSAVRPRRRLPVLVA